MKEYLIVANELGMWIACSFVVLVVIFQALLFMSRAYKAGIKMGIAPEKLKSGMRSGAITSIGPSVAVVIAMVSLIASLGGPFAWMRLSVIGSVPFELMAASAGAEAMGLELGGEGYGLLGYANSIWTCTLGAAGWLVLCALFTHKFNDLRMYVVRGNEALLPILSVSAMIGAFAYFGAPYLALRGSASTASYITGGIVMIIITKICQKYNWNALKEWSLGIAMVAGMFTALIFV